MNRPPPEFCAALFESLALDGLESHQRAVRRLVDRIAAWAALGFWYPDPEYGREYLRPLGFVLCGTPRPIRLAALRRLRSEGLVERFAAYDWIDCQTRGGVWWSGIEVERKDRVLPLARSLGLVGETVRDPRAEGGTRPATPDDVAKALDDMGAGDEYDSLGSLSFEAQQDAKALMAVLWHGLSDAFESRRFVCSCQSCREGLSSKEMAAVLDAPLEWIKAGMSALAEAGMATCSPITICDRTGVARYGLWRHVPGSELWPLEERPAIAVQDRLPL